MRDSLRVGVGSNCGCPGPCLHVVDRKVMVSWSQHYHGQVLHWWEARSSICRREIGCQRSLVLELLRAALLMKSDATNACNLCGDMFLSGSEPLGSALVAARAWW